jgi:hypothetical protein
VPRDRKLLRKGVIIMTVQFVITCAIALVAVGYAAAEAYVRTARRRDAARIARARRGLPAEPPLERGMPDEKEQERDDPRPIAS